MKLRYDTVLFDLDGTLTNPSEGITNSIMHALSKRGIEVTDRRSLYRFIGPPLLESFSKYYGFSSDESRSALMDYREYFSTRGLFENEVIDGCEDMLHTLKNAGCRVVLATSKPEPYARRIIEHFGLMPYFDAIFGATMDEKLSRKTEIIEFALKNLPDCGRTVMVGDRMHDIEGACENGIDSIGVLCGFGSEQELRDAGATYIVRSLDCLPAIVLKGLSILIPVYNFDASALIRDLHAQGMALQTGFELIVADDASTDRDTEALVREAASGLDHCRYIPLETNAGRSAIRNMLADNAVFDSLLFIDCDAKVCSKSFLADYMKAADRAQVVCGGLRHEDSCPGTGKELRYKYEKRADRYRGASYRTREPYARFTPFSFLIDRECFMRIRFDTGFKGYGYEDVLFGMELERRGVSILHIDNPLIHTGIESSDAYLAKTGTAVGNLLERRDTIGRGSRLLEIYDKVCRLRLKWLVNGVGKTFSKGIRRNLTGRNPWLWLFSFYKLYLICSMDK